MGTIVHSRKKQWPAYSLGLKHLEFISLREHSGHLFLATKQPGAGFTRSPK